MECLEESLMKTLDTLFKKYFEIFLIREFNKETPEKNLWRTAWTCLDGIAKCISGGIPEKKCLKKSRETPMTEF